MDNDKTLSKDEQKAKIRKRYKGISPDELTIIPANPTENIFDNNTHKRVGIYARVSTESVNQTSSYELQKNYYEDMVNRHPNWDLVEIYADEGISGTSLNHREAFVRMIKDCQKGMIDMIITKTVPRFARNVVDCIDYARQLKAMKPQVGIYFETENIYTLDDNSEMQLSFLATLAQEESHNKSQSMNRSIEMRFERGIFLTPVLLGYDHDEDGNLIINEEEAKTVKLIYAMYMAGEDCVTIAETLTELERITKKNNKIWSSSSVYGILQNERYCGDVLARKTYTPNYLTHKSVKNEHDRPKYYQKDHHEAIINRDEYVAVQKIIANNKYGYRKASPDIKVIEDGVLKGFVQFNPLWRGFNVQDYLDASLSVLDDNDYLNPIVKFRVNKGDFDFSSYQVARDQYLTNCRKVCVNISIKQMKFSFDAVNDLNIGGYIEILYNPLYEIMVVRKGKRDNRHSMKWAVLKEGRLRPYRIGNVGFIDILYRFCDWDDNKRYSVNGYMKEQSGERLLVFFMDEAVVRIKRNDRYIDAYPEDWESGFGKNYYEQKAKEISMFVPGNDWKIDQPGIVANDPDFIFPDKEKMKEEYLRMIEELRNEV